MTFPIGSRLIWIFASLNTRLLWQTGSPSSFASEHHRRSLSDDAAAGADVVVRSVHSVADGRAFACAVADSCLRD